VIDLNDNLSNLFILRSPLQIINAMEAIEHFQLKNNILVLIYNRMQNNIEQMNLVLDTQKFTKIIHINEKLKSKYFEYVKLIRKLKKENYNYLFIGELGVSYKIIVANTRKEKVFLLDDGTATIEYYNKFIKYNKYNKYNFREIRFLFSGLNIKVKDKINLFTYFNLVPLHGIDVVKNNLSYLNNNVVNTFKKDESIMYFIGQPIEGTIAFDVYKNGINYLIKNFNKKIVYIPHRSENKEQQNRLLLSISSEMFEIINPNMPLELYFLKNSIYPLHIVSYISTALVTLTILFKECKADFIRILETVENKKRINRINDVYTILNKIGIKELDM
jgi:ACT domain-containing protein